MLFKRQRLLLQLLDGLGGSAGHTDFQKWLFFYIQAHEPVPPYEFVPYRFGGFSFSSYADKRRLIQKGFLADNDQRWQLTNVGRDAARTHADRSPHIAAFCRRYSALRGNELILEQYKRFPYYASRSTLVESLPLNPEDRKRIESACPAPQEPGLLTIGYEGRSLENYLNALFRDAVTILCDVRRIPISRKYGFSKRTLDSVCEQMGIRYEHLPELGIASAKRRRLLTQTDYDRLFEEYERTTLRQHPAALDKIRDWIAEGARVALTCYEQVPARCHRGRIAKALAANTRHL